MKKALLLATLLALPVAGFAADDKGPQPLKGAPAAKAAPAAKVSKHGPAPKVTKEERRAHVRTGQQRGTAMSACQDKADKQQLRDVDRKVFIAGCVKQGA
jgi:hypothetical protein